MISARKRILSLSFLFCATLLMSCGSHQPADDGQTATEMAAPAAVKPKKDSGGALPVQFQYPSYVVGQENDPAAAPAAEEAVLKVGAKIETKRGPQQLWTIMKGLADLKRMNVSWASDVDQNALVDVHINANDDFYDALGNLLRQIDYYYEVKGNTIVVKYKETRNFQIAMPFTKTQYSTSVGGNMLGGQESSKDMDGTIQLKSKDNEFDIWKNIEGNLDALLGIWALDPNNKAKSAQEDASMSDAAIMEKCQQDWPAADPRKLETCIKAQKDARSNLAKMQADLAPSSQGNKAAKTSDQKSASGKSESGNYYIIDKPVGIITVSAPRPLLEKVDEYFTNLKKSLYRQVSIEAKIIEVRLNDSSSIGINWNNVLSNFQALAGTLNFGANGQVYPYISAVNGQSGWVQGNRLTGYINGSNVLHPLKTDANGNTTNVIDNSANVAMMASTALMDPGRFISSVVLQPANFSAMINALKTEGQTKVLSSPKLSVMNGQPAMISVGRNYTYIKAVNVDVDAQTGQRTYTVSTERLLSGLGMSLTATILGDNEIIMNLVPVTSELVPSASAGANPDEPIYSKRIGDTGMEVGLPILNVREMSTTVKVRDGEMLAIGGLISESEGKEGNFVPILGSIPIIKYLFGYETKQKQKNELIILLKPKII